MLTKVNVSGTPIVTFDKYSLCETILNQSIKRQKNSTSFWKR